MLPSVGEWLSASWRDYKRLWARLMIVLAAGSVVTIGAALLPFIPAAAAIYYGEAPAWAALAGAWSLALLAGLLTSTWAQAAAMRAAIFDESAAESLRAGWRQTLAFAWVLSLAMLAAGGGFFLLIVPGLLLTVLLFFAPFYQLAGEEEGMGAVELSFARVRPALGAAAGRLLLAALIVWLPSRIPYIGWLIAMLWAPFGLVACARLAADLKVLTPAPERPRLLVPVVALSLLFVVAGGLATWTVARGASALYASYAAGTFVLPAPDSDTAQSLLAVIQGRGTEEDARRSTSFVLALSSAATAPSAATAFEAENTLR